MSNKKIVVIGGGLAGRTCITALREADKKALITLVDKSPNSFSKQKLITELSFDKGIELEQFTKENNCEFLQAIVDRINPNRKKIHFKEGQPLDYDVLVLATGLGPRKLEIKGDHREGFFYLSDMEPVALKDLLHINDEALVLINSNLGFKLFYALKKLGKEVRVIAGNWNWLGEDKEAIINSLKSQEVPCYFDTIIEEAIGEGVVKAVKIIPLKVVSAQLVFMDTGFIPNLSFFEQEITVKEGLLTDLEDVLVTGTASFSDLGDNPFFNWSDSDIEKSAKQCAQYVLTGANPGSQLSQVEDSTKNAIIEDVKTKLQQISVNTKQDA
jgi:thioredoxin reductase